MSGGGRGGREREEGGREARDLFPGMINDVSGDLDRYAHGDRCKQQPREGGRGGMNGPLSCDSIRGFKQDPGPG